jgi:hypothetical protein
MSGALHSRMAVDTSPGVYMILNRTNGKIYVGSAINPALRWRDHVRLLNNGAHTNRNLLLEWHQFGKVAFEFSILENVPDTRNLTLREQFWINEYSSAEATKGYNMQKVAVRRSGRPGMARLYKPKDIWWLEIPISPMVLKTMRTHPNAKSSLRATINERRLRVSLKTSDPRAALERASGIITMHKLASHDLLTPSILDLIMDAYCTDPPSATDSEDAQS